MGPETHCQANSKRTRAQNPPRKTQKCQNPPIPPPTKKPPPPIQMNKQNPQAGVVVNEYEKQRQARIAQNRARMEALGLPTTPSSPMGPTQIPNKKTSCRNTSKGKAKMVWDDDDAEYRPQEEQGLESSSSSDDDDDDDDYEDEEFSLSAKPKRKSKGGKRKNARSKSSLRSSEYLEDDDALKQAIALSLQGSAGSDVVNDNVKLRKGENQNQQDSGRKRKKPQFTSRIQMTEDELVLHFFQLDENCNGGVSARDLEKIAIAHDFTWTDKELSDMINFYDSDRDGKLSLEDFRKIVVRCNMIKAP